MHVTTEVKAKVITKLKAGIALAEAKYGITIPMPTVVYHKRGTTAGTANYRSWTIDLNPTLLMQNVEDFIARTVPHELAHLINDKVYPESHATEIVRSRSGRLKRTKRDVHGATWQSVCRVLGMTNITRCHQYDTTDAKIVKPKRRTIEWKCPCGAKLMLTPAKSAKLDAAPGSMWHRGCSGRIMVRVAAIKATIDLRQYGAIMHSALPAPTVTVPTVPAYAGTKLDQCKALYLKFSMLSRAEIINKFTALAGCTPAGAGTYYATCKKVYG